MTRKKPDEQQADNDRYADPRRAADDPRRGDDYRYGTRTVARDAKPFPDDIDRFGFAAKPTPDDIDRIGARSVDATPVLAASDARPAQATIRGVLTDQDGRILRDKYVHILGPGHIGTPDARHAITNARGEYRFEDLPAGTYKAFVGKTERNVTVAAHDVAVCDLAVPQ